MRESQIRKLMITKCSDLSLSKAHFIYELKLGRGKVIADMVAINDGVHGYEIKSKFDNLNRLKHQISGYSKIFDSVTIVCDIKHQESVSSFIPPWFGIVLVDESGFTVVREAGANPLLKPEYILEILKKDELFEWMNVNKSLNINKNFRYSELKQLALKAYTKTEISHMFRECLKIRALSSLS